MNLLDRVIFGIGKFVDRDFLEQICAEEEGSGRDRTDGKQRQRTNPHRDAGNKKNGRLRVIPTN